MYILDICTEDQPYIFKSYADALDYINSYASSNGIIDDGYDIFDLRKLSKEDLVITKVPNSFAKDWILNKHYARRPCSVSYTFGLFTPDNVLRGIATFGYPPNYNFNNGKCIFKTHEVLTLELNRLITEGDLPENTLSYFLSQALKQLPSPCAIVSYADPNAGHYGFIYQATNWIYTGNSTPKLRYHFQDGTTFDIRRGLDAKIIKHGPIIKKEKLIPTQRYIFINASKGLKRKLIKDMKMKSCPYPKGQNTNYDINAVDDPLRPLKEGNPPSSS